MDNDLIYSLDNISLVPWQSTILIWGCVITVLLFLAMIAMIFLHSKKKQTQDKIYAVSYLLLSAFLLALGISAFIAISFLVYVEMGWVFSLLAGVSVIVLAVSIVKMMIGMLGELSLDKLFTWIVLGMASLSLIIVLAAASLQKAHG